MNNTDPTCFECKATANLVMLEFTGRITDFDGIFYVERTTSVHACRGHTACYYATLKKIHDRLQNRTDQKVNDVHDVTIREVTVNPFRH